jgi:hypothetical protein
MRLLGWHTPDGNGIEEMVERYRLYPVTMLELRRHDLLALQEAGFVMTADILDGQDKVQRLLPGEVASDVIRQAEALSG